MTNWRYTGASDPEHVRLYASLGRYAVADSNGDIHQIDDTGSNLWTTADPSGSGAAPVSIHVDGDYVHALYSGGIYILDINGNVNASMSISGTPREIIGISSTESYVAEGDTVYEYDVSAGTVTDSYTTSGGEQIHSIAEGFDNVTLFAGRDDGNVVGLDNTLSVLNNVQYHASGATVTHLNGEGNLTSVADDNVMKYTTDDTLATTSWSTTLVRQPNDINRLSSYIITGDGVDIRHLNNNDGEVSYKVDVPNPVNSVERTTAPNRDTVTALDGDAVYEYDETEITLEPETASQPTASASTNDATVTSAQVTSTQSAASASMNSPALTEFASATQPTGAATMLTADTLDKKAASQVSVSTSMNTVSVQDVTGYDYSRRVTINSGQVDADYSNFPIWVDITNDTHLDNNAQTDGSDIHFRDGDGTRLDFEKIVYSNGTWRGWVEVDEVKSSEDVDIFLYYGADFDIGTLEDEEGTWDDNTFDSVWHLETLDGDDSNSSNTMQDVGGEPTVVSAITEKGYDYDVTGSKINTDANQDWVLSFWFKADNIELDTGIQNLLTKDDDTGGEIFKIYLDDETLVFESDESTARLQSPSNISETTWYHVTAYVSQSNDERGIILEGQNGDYNYEVDTSYTFNGNYQHTEVNVAADKNGTATYRGKMDEIRHLPVDLVPLGPENWHGTNFENQENSGTFTSLGSPAEPITASQPSAAATMNSTSTQSGVFGRDPGVTVSMNDAQVTSTSAAATQTTVPATMNPDAGVTSAQVTSTQFGATAIMNALGAKDTVTATQVSAPATMHTTSVQESGSSWNIKDKGGNSYAATLMRLDEGIPQFRRGREITRTFIFSKDTGASTHENTYETIRERFGEYLTENTTKMVSTFRGETRFRQNLNPQTNAESYVWEVTPNPSLQDDLDSWWVLVTNIEDTTTMVGPSESLEVTMVPLAPTSEGDRTYIEDNFEV